MSSGKRVIEYHIEVGAIQTYGEFVAAFNAGMIESFGGHWGGDLNAFNDYLTYPEPQPYRIVLVGWAHCAATLAGLPYWGGGMILPAIEDVFRDNPQALLSFA